MTGEPRREEVGPPAARRRWYRRPRVVAGVAGFNALAAWGGAIALLSGATDFGEVATSRLPFESLVLAGAALALIVAVPLTALAWTAWTEGERTAELALLVGVLLIGWILVQIVVLRTYSFFQPMYLGIGAYFVAMSGRVHLGRRAEGFVLLAVGCVLVAAGVGLAPFLVKQGVAPSSVVSLGLLVGGGAAVVAGARRLLRPCGLGGRIAGGLATLLAVALAVWLVAPGVAATNVPRPEVGAAPDARLHPREATITTRDGVELAAWYLPGTNGAGVVVLHGAGSTRSDVVEQASAIARSGYSVLLVDARGHGDSGGIAMDFGWFGDQDVEAATRFLADQPEVERDRIGLVGFSMGGEEAIGASASDSRVRAVVAEGATGRRASDKSWLSDAYGWRGWVQERVEDAQYGIVDYLSEASPPTGLRGAVEATSDVRYLLITAGSVEDEGRAAAHIRSGDPDRVEVWEVSGADHTGAYAEDPEGWARRVVSFLDQALA